MVNPKNIVDKIFSNYVQDLEKRYDEEKSRECEELHNSIGQVLKDKKASIQNALFVLEFIKIELLRAEYEKVMGNVKIPEGNIPIKTQ